MEQNLINACKCGDVEAVKRMVSIKELNWNVWINRLGMTVLHYACWTGQLELVRFLLTLKEVSVDKKDNVGETPLHHACRGGYLEVVRFLLSLYEVNVNAKDYDGATPFHCACRVGQLKVVRFLSTLNQVNVNEKDNIGDTPLHYACRNEALDVAKFLIEVEGADYSIQNKDGEKPIDVRVNEAAQGSSYIYCLENDEPYCSVIDYIEYISENSNFSLSCQKKRRLQRFHEKTFISLAVHEDDEFDCLIDKILNEGVCTIEEVQSLAQHIATTQDVVIYWSIVKAFIKLNGITQNSCVKAIEYLFDRILDKKLAYTNQAYTFIKRLLDELKEIKLISRDNYVHWEQQIRKINAENSLRRNEVIVVNTANILTLSSKYSQLYDFFQQFHYTYTKQSNCEIILEFLRTGVNMLSLIPVAPGFNGVVDSTMDISNPLEFSRIVFEEEGLKAFVEHGTDELLLKPTVKYILKMSKIDEKFFVSIFQRILCGIPQDLGSNIEGKQGLVMTITDNQASNDRWNANKGGNNENSLMEDTIPEARIYQEKNVAIEKNTNEMDLVDLCKALKNTIYENDFIDKLTKHQYITALHFSEGDLSIFKRLLNYISPTYNVNEAAKLYIKRDGSEDVQTVITAIQYAAVCGYVTILEDFFLSIDQREKIDFGLDNPVTYLAIAIKKHSLM